MSTKINSLFANSLHTLSKSFVEQQQVLSVVRNGYHSDANESKSERDGDTHAQLSAQLLVRSPCSTEPRVTVYSKLSVLNTVLEKVWNGMASSSSSSSSSDTNVRKPLDDVALCFEWLTIERKVRGDGKNGLYFKFRKSGDAGGHSGGGGGGGGRSGGDTEEEEKMVKPEFVVQDVAEEVTLILSLQTDTFYVHLDHDVNELNVDQLDALWLSGYAFCPTDSMIHAAGQANVQVLTWMRTRAGFHSGPISQGPWSQKETLTSLARACDKYSLAEHDLTSEECRLSLSTTNTWSTLQKIHDIEQCASLVFNKKYWTHPDDNVTFPFMDFLDVCYEHLARKPVLEWFLSRAQFLFPLEKCTSGEEAELENMISFLVTRGDTELAIKLHVFLKTNGYPKSPASFHPVTILSKL